MNVQRRRYEDDLAPSPARTGTPATRAVGMDRRGWLRAAIAAIGGAIAATLATVAGGAVALGRDDDASDAWIAAARLDDLAPGVPTPVTVRATRRDGYYESVDRQVLFLVRGDRGEVTALSSTCTHLGCRVSYDRAANVLKCPCHGGRYAPDGRVIGGPPPRPLDTIAARVDGSQVLVRL